ncbi:hypothetical protein [Streptomyces sp. NPDC058694]|uniref:hypothetical protein n=1 Tax=Streptomyces sp. NPDC058694 TaxID=3346603 RepID=UPI0036538A0E
MNRESLLEGVSSSQKVTVAQALLAEPELLVLDEHPPRLINRRVDGLTRSRPCVVPPAIRRRGTG